MANYTPSPPTFGAFTTDSNITYTGSWLVRTGEGQPFLPMDAQDAKYCSQAQFNQQLYTASTPWSKIIADCGPKYTKVYAGHYMTITDDVIDCGASKLQNIASAVNSTDAINKANLDSAITAVNATITSANTTNQTYTNTKVDEQKVRIDNILSGASLSLDSLKEVSDLCNALDATQAQDILTKTTTLTNSLNAEITRATTAEADLKKKAEFQIDVLPVPSVYADCEQPYQIPSSIKSSTTPGSIFSGVDGWYFKNSTAGKKINWYLPNVSTLKVSDIVNITFDATLFSATSPPFILSLIHI
jgi:hypothetical protein